MMKPEPFWPRSTKDWQPYRKLITHLYRDENKSLKEVQHILESTYNFKATDKMYKRNIRIWGIDKNHKYHEVVEILRVEAQRAAEGKRSIFVLRGQPVDMRSVHQYIERKKKMIHQDLNRRNCQEDVAGSARNNRRLDLVCLTPSLSPVSLAVDPGNTLNETESFYLVFNQYLVGSIEIGAWIPSRDTTRLNNSLCPCDRWVEVLGIINLGVRRFQDGYFQEAMRHWRIASANLEPVVHSWNYYQLLNLISAIGNLAECDERIAQILLQHLGRLVSLIPRAQNPQQLVLDKLSKLDPKTFHNILLFTRRCCLPIFQLHFARHESFVLFWETALAQLESHQGVWTYSPLLLPRMVERLVSDQEDSIILLLASERLIMALRDANRDEEAEYLSHLHIQRLQRMKQDDFVLEQLFRALEALADTQTRLERYQEAHDTYLQAKAVYAGFMQSNGPEDRSWAERHMLDVLKNLANLELSMGLLIEAEAHKTHLVEFEVALDEQALGQLISQRLVDV